MNEVPHQAAVFVKQVSPQNKAILSFLYIQNCVVENRMWFIRGAAHLFKPQFSKGKEVIWVDHDTVFEGEGYIKFRPAVQAHHCPSKAFFACCMPHAFVVSRSHLYY